MQVTMQHAERLTLAEMREFLDASSNLSFAGTGRKQIYGLLEGVLRSQKYLGLAKKDKGIVRRYLVKISGLSVAQITRLIARWRERGVIEPRTARRYRFPQRYTNDDILLLATTDGAHEGLPAPAIRRILQREFKVHGQANDERLASISASHIYNLRRTRIYREQRVHHTKTRASAVAIGERRKPEPRGRPGFLRVDAVHQGDSGSRKGIYHINAVDTVTQWQNVGCCETISKAHFIPVLEAILHQFPYRILGFHSDNGSEFINYQVEKLLNNLVIHFTLVGGLGLGDNVSIGQGLTENQLFDESVEDLAYVAGLSTVEAKGEFIEVALQMHFTHLSLVRRYQPALEQRGNQVDMREFLGGYLRVSRCVGDPIAIAGFLQAPVTPPAVAMDQTA